MKKNKNIKTIIEKLNEEQLREFVDGLDEDQIYTLFEARAWTSDELRSLFSDMEQDDSERFFSYLKSEQLQFLLEMIIGDEEDIEIETDNKQCWNYMFANSNQDE